MAKMPSFLQQAAGGYSPQDLQQAIVSGGPTALQAGQGVASSTAPFVNAANEMSQLQMQDRWKKKEMALEKARMRSANLMSALSLGTDLAFGSIGAGTKLGALGEMSRFNKGVAGRATVKQASSNLTGSMWNKPASVGGLL